MRHMRHAALWIGILLCAGCAQESEKIAESPANPATTKAPAATPPKTIPYVVNGEATQQLDLYLPKNADAKTPLVLFVHGGAWGGGDKRNHAAMAYRFEADGIATAVVNYRLSPGVKNPVHVQDVATAYAWLVNNSNQKFSPMKIFVMGHSAGAHNAGMLATGDFLLKAGVDSASQPKGYIGLEGIYDIPNLIKVWPGYKAWFIDKAFGPETNWAAGSPTRRKLQNKAPWLVIHSTEDELVDLAQARDFAAHLKQSGVDVTLNDTATGKHDQVINSIGDAANPVTKQIEDFIKKHS